MFQTYQNSFFTSSFRLGTDILMLIVLWIIGATVFSERHIRKEQEKRETGYLLVLIGAQTLMLIFALIRDVVWGCAGLEAIAYYMQYASYVTVLISAFFINLYIVDDLRRNAYIHDNVNYIVAFVCGTLCILWTIGFFRGNNWFGIKIDSYQWNINTGFILMQFVPSVVLIFDLFLAGSCIKIIGKEKLRAWSFITITPILGAVLYVLFQGFPLEPVNAISGIVLYVNIYVSKTRQMMESEKELTDSKAKLMVSQIQPHFIYNSLNTIYYLIEQDSEQAQEAVSTFSDYLRQNINSLKDDKPVLFKEELSHIDAYLYLETLRFGDELKIEKDIKATDFYIPPLTVQPLVENAIKHGVSVKEGGGTVKISSWETYDDFIVEITDDGVGFEAGKFKDNAGTHIGLFNVNNRIKIMCGGSLYVESRLGEGTKCIITLPKECQKKY